MKVSVAMATYNGGDFLRQQLQSILNQTTRPDQLVILDDGSTDLTANICNDYCESFGQFLFQRNSSRLGPTANFMAAIAKCTGDIVVLCDQDDAWVPTKIERIVERFQNPDVMVAYHSSVLMASDGKISDVRFPDLTEDLSAQVNCFLPIYGMSLAFSGKLLPVLIPPYSHLMNDFCGHDHWIYFVGAMFGKIVHIGEPLAMYRRHEFNTVSLPSVRSMRDRFSATIRDYRRVLGRTKCTLAAYDKWKADGILADRHVRPDVLIYYQRVAEAYEAKLKVVRADGEGLRSALTGLTCLMRMRAYLPKMKYGLRLASFPKDVAYALNLMQLVGF